MSKSFTLKSGKVTGRNHLLSLRNCQDSLKTVSLEINHEQYYLGWIADGCSSGLYSEVGANLATEFLIHQSISLLRDDFPGEIIPLFLFEDLLTFLKINLDSQPLDSPQEQATYIHNFLLFTLIGFLIGPRHTTVMAYGDGLIVLNDQVYLRDFQNVSPYPAYLLVDPKYLKSDSNLFKREFDLYHIDSNNLEKLAIGDDAWLPEMELISQIWGHQHPNQIQRNMNIWSDQKKLADDASLIVVETTK